MLRATHPSRPTGHCEVFMVEQRCRQRCWWTRREVVAGHVKELYDKCTLSTTMLAGVRVRAADWSAGLSVVIRSCDNGGRAELSQGLPAACAINSNHPSLFVPIHRTSPQPDEIATCISITHSLQRNGLINQWCGLSLEFLQGPISKLDSGSPRLPLHPTSPNDVSGSNSRIVIHPCAPSRSRLRDT